MRIVARSETHVTTAVPRLVPHARTLGSTDTDLWIHMFRRSGAESSARLVLDALPRSYSVITASRSEPVVVRRQ